MGGGAGKLDFAKLDAKYSPKYNKPFHIEMDLECEDWDVVYDSNAAEVGGGPAGEIEGNLQKGHTRKLVFELRGDICPYACENFRRLACEPVGPGKPAAYVGSFVHDCMPQISVSGGRVGTAGADAPLKNKSRSAFGGKAFGDETDGESELEHERGSLCLTTEKKGAFGSQWSVFLGETGGAQAYTLDESETSIVIGRMVRGFTALNDLGKLMATMAWLKKNRREFSKTEIASPGGVPAKGVRVSACREVPGWTETRAPGKRGSIAIFDKPESKSGPAK